MNIKRKAALVAVAVATLVMSGCVKIHTTVTLHSDNTVDQNIIMAVDPSLLEGQEDTFNAEALNADVPAEFKDRVTVKDYTDSDGKRGIDMTVKGITFEELADGGAFGGDGDPTAAVLGGEGPTYVREGDIFIVTYPVSASDAETGGMDPSMMADMLDVKFKFQFPGDVIETTKGTIDGNSVTLSAKDLMTGDDVVIRANAVGGGSGSFLVWILVGVGVLVLAGAVALILIASKKKQGAPAVAVNGAPVAPPAPPAAPTAPPAAPSAPPAPPAAPPAPPAAPPAPPAPPAE